MARRMQAPINSIKHYVYNENTATANGSARTIVLVDAAPAPANTNTFDVKEGAIVKAVFFELWLRSNAAAGTSMKFQLVIEKAPSGVDSVTFTQSNNLQTYDNKKNVLHFSQGVLGDIATTSLPIFKSWILIPKGKQRFGLGDRLVATISATSATLNNCGFATYKEYN